MRMKVTSIGLLLLLLSGCGSLELAHDAAVPQLEGSSSLRVAVGVLDKRTHAYSYKPAQADLVGFMVGPNIYVRYYNWRDLHQEVTTEAKQPFAEVFEESIITGFRRNGIEAFSVSLQPNYDQRELAELAAEQRADRIVAVVLNTWHTETFLNTQLAYDVVVEVTDGRGRRLAKNTLEGVRAYGSKQSDDFPYTLYTYDATEVVAPIMADFLAEMLNAPEIVRVLDGNPNLVAEPTTSAESDAPAEVEPEVAVAATLSAETEAWEAIRTSRNPEDYEAFLASYPNSAFADLARSRAAVPGNRVWSPAFAEPIPRKEKWRVDAFFLRQAGTALAELERYNSSNNVLAPNRSSTDITEIQSYQVLAADPDGAVVKLTYVDGGRSWGTLDSHIYEMRWDGDILRPTRHQDP